MDHYGELAGLSCSFSWAICSLAFAWAGRRIGADAVNQIRIFMAAIALMALHALLVGGVWPEQASARQIATLALSGFLGLALGDLLLFSCMAILGPRLGALLMSTAPVMTMALAGAFFGEALTGKRILGILVVSVGVATVLWDGRNRENWRPPENTRFSRSGAIVLGLFAALGQALGSVLTKHGLSAQGTELELASLSGTLVRMLAAAVGALAIALVMRRMGAMRAGFRDGRAIRATALGALFGPVLGVWASVYAVKHADASVAQTLMSLSPVVLLFIARFAYGSRPGLFGYVGTFAVVVGGSLLF